MNKIKADLHYHLKKSFCENDFDKIICKIEKRLDRGGILGVINYNDFRYENFTKLKKGYDIQNLENAIYIPEKEILIIKGQEILNKNGHLLILGIKENHFLKNKRTLEDSLKEAKDLNGIVIAPHPFFIFGSGNHLRKNPKLLKYLDGIEVHNGEAFFGNKKAKMFYELIKEDYDFGALSSSDGHSLYEIGNCYTSLNLNDFSFKNSEELNNNLRKSIKNHKDYSNDKQHFSFLSSLEHSIKTIISLTKTIFNPTN